MRIDPFDTPEPDDSARQPESDGPGSVETGQADETRETVRKALRSGSAGKTSKRSDGIGEKIGERASFKAEKDASSRFIDLYDLNGMLEEK
ncbi:hypothetical protein HZA44_01720 [Candidatus Peregrinibacteria bacterium]|nr:hypothetical protein [Candidatus Peregrinibacteria bacterium]